MTPMTLKMSLLRRSRSSSRGHTCRNLVNAIAPEPKNRLNNNLQKIGIKNRVYGVMCSEIAREPKPGISRV